MTRVKTTKNKLIDPYQKYLIECDNKECDFKVLNPTGDINECIAGFVHVKCPECGDRLLTVKDYLDYQKMVDGINRINKWFGWLVFFKRKRKLTDVSVKVHDGIKLSHNEPSQDE